MQEMQKKTDSGKDSFRFLGTREMYTQVNILNLYKNMQEPL